jgi:hypothetical protein
MSNGTGQEHRVTIFTQGGSTKVWPPYLVVKAGDSVTFRAIGTSATVIFPHCAAFDMAVTPQKNFVQPQQGSEILIRVGKDEPASVVTQKDTVKMDLANLRSRWGGSMVTEDNCQIYAYSVYCGELNDLAQGQSSPVMIIEPPEREP